MVAIVGAVGVAGRVARRVLQLADEPAQRRRFIADRIPEPRVETALYLRQRSLRPDGRCRENRRRQRWRIAEDGKDVVVRSKEPAQLERAPVALEANEGLAPGERAAARIRLD